MSKWSKDSRGRRDVIMAVAFIDAMYDGGILIFCMVGIVGMCMEMVLRKCSLEEICGKRTPCLCYGGE